MFEAKMMDQAPWCPCMAVCADLTLQSSLGSALGMRAVKQSDAA